MFTAPRPQLAFSLKAKAARSVEKPLPPEEIRNLWNACCEPTRRYQSQIHCSVPVWRNLLLKTFHCTLTTFNGHNDHSSLRCRGNILVGGQGWKPTQQLAVWLRSFAGTLHVKPDELRHLMICKDLQSKATKKNSS